MPTRNLRDIAWQERFDHQKSILFGEEDFASKGTKLQLIKIAPGKTIGPHYHKIRTEAFYVLSGTGFIQLGDENIHVSRDDFLLCKPGTTHSFRCNGSNDLIIAVFRTNDPGDSDMLWVGESAQVR